MTALAITLMLLAMPAASAHTTDAIAETGGTMTTLPILGAGLQVEIVLDASGNLEQVNLDPATGIVATELDAHEVEFKITDTSTEVEVEAEGDELQVEVESATLADLLGPGTWSADLFGTGMVTVPYEIGEVDGAPMITLGEITAPAGVEVTIEAEAESDEAEAEIFFTQDGVTKTLRIGIEADGDEAELEISLQGPSDEDDFTDDDDPSLEIDDDEISEVEDDDDESEDEEGHDDPTTNVTVIDDDSDSGD